ncbi:Probable phospholipid hydroperoxide glutathione peroxidase [Linum perenne]
MFELCCSGLTNSNYTELTELYKKYKDQGLEILAFPCNQFGSQEPGNNEQIMEFACTRFKAEYPIFDKVSFRDGSSKFFSCCLVNNSRHHLILSITILKLAKDSRIVNIPCWRIQLN